MAHAQMEYGELVNYLLKLVPPSSVGRLGGLRSERENGVKTRCNWWNLSRPTRNLLLNYYRCTSVRNEQIREVLEAVKKELQLDCVTAAYVIEDFLKWLDEVVFAAGIKETSQATPVTETSSPVKV